MRSFPRSTVEDSNTAASTEVDFQPRHLVDRVSVKTVALPSDERSHQKRTWLRLGTTMDDGSTRLWVAVVVSFGLGIASGTAIRLAEQDDPVSATLPGSERVQADPLRKKDALAATSRLNSHSGPSTSAWRQVSANASLVKALIANEYRIGADFDSRLLGEDSFDPGRADLRRAIRWKSFCSTPASARIHRCD